MFHPSTVRLLDYWRAQRGEDSIPRRASIDPTQVLELLPGLFMLGRESAGHYQFRLVGALLQRMHSQDLRQVDFLSLWRQDDRISLQMALEAVRRRGEPLVVSAEVRGEGGHAMDMEIVLAPLAGSNGEADRFFGLYQPTSSIEALMDLPMIRMSVRAITAPDNEDGLLPRLRLAAAHGAPVEETEELPAHAWSRRPA